MLIRETILTAWLLVLTAALATEDELCCLSVLKLTLWDSFGDGWGNTYLRVITPQKLQFLNQPSCGTAEVIIIDPCDNLSISGNYEMHISRTDTATSDEGSWEIYWRVDVVNHDGDLTQNYLQGGYDTFMTWNYDNSTDQWTAVEAINTANSATSACISCSNTKCHRSFRDSEKFTSYSSTTQNRLAMYSYGTPNTDLELIMRAPSNWLNWSVASPLGAFWTVSDYANAVAFEQGSLCDHATGICNMCLGEGSYIFRVTGVMSANDTLSLKQGITRCLALSRGTEEPVTGFWWNESQSMSKYNIPHSDHNGNLRQAELLPRPEEDVWSFCHARGTFGDQLSFHVTEGKCIPDVLIWAGETCGMEQNSTINTAGILSIDGVKGEIFYSKDFGAILGSLERALSYLTIDSLTIVGSSLNTPRSEPMENHFVHDVKFRLAFLAEKNGANGIIFAEVERLTRDIASIIQMSISSGNFLSDFIESAEKVGSEYLVNVSIIDLEYLTVEGVSYSNNRLIYFGDSQYRDESSLESITSRAFILVTVLVIMSATIVGAAMLLHRCSPTYKPLPSLAESDHGAYGYRNSRKQLNKMGFKFQGADDACASVSEFEQETMLINSVKGPIKQDVGGDLQLEFSSLATESSSEHSSYFTS